MATKSMWELTEELAKKHDQAGGTWLKLAGDGDKAVVVFLGEPYPREVCFVDGRYLPFDDELKAAGHKASLRVAFNVALYETKEVKVFEQGRVFFTDLMEVRAKYGLEKWCFEATRHGPAKEPKTSYSILPEKQLTPQEQRAFQALPLHDLERLYTEDATEADTHAAGAFDSYDAKKSAAPIDAKTAQSIVVVLKALPREATDRFCKKFGIARIKDLPAAQIEKAVVYLDDLEAEFKQSAAADEPVDPFA